LVFLIVTRSLLAVFLVMSAVWDIRKRRVPNRLSLAVGVTGLVAILGSEGWVSALSGLGAAAVILALLWFPWSKGRIGGGDVKLTAAAAISAEIAQLPWFLLGTAVIGGMLSAVCYLLSSREARREMTVNFKLVAAGVLPEPPLRSGRGRISVPYSVASAAMALVILFAAKGW